MTPADGSSVAMLGKSAPTRLATELPRNTEAEQALLAAIMVNNAAYEKVVDTGLKAEHFAEGVHGRIFQASATIINRSQIANPVTLGRLFDQDGALAEIGGREYLVKLLKSVVTIIAAPDYAKEIIDCWRRRRVIELAETAIGEAYAASLDGDATAICARLADSVAALQDGADQKTGPRSLASFGTDALALADHRYKNKGKVSGITTGFIDIDRVTGGLQPSDLTILGGRPGMGKSALAAGIAFHAAKAGHPAIFFSLEMSGVQLALRYAAEATGISAQRVMTGDIESDDFPALIRATDFSALPLEIDQTGVLSLATIRARVRRFAIRCRKLPNVATIAGKPAPMLVVVDHLGLMAPPDNRRQSSNRTQDVSEFSAGLKAIAKEFNAPVLALSQLSRAVEQREDKRPRMADLRDSGSIEQDADVIAFLFRESYYLAQSEPTRSAGQADEKFNEEWARWNRRNEEVHGIAELIINKNRQGPTSTLRLRFDGERTAFDNLIRDPGPAYSSLNGAHP
jgi:replicative DNA helicase